MIAMLVDGDCRSGGGRETIAVVDPATQDVVDELTLANPADIDDALSAAARAWPDWRAKPAFERYQILRQAAGLLRERAETVAHRMTLEQGKVLAESRTEVHAAADILDWFAEEGRRAYGRIIPSKVSGGRDLVLREPVGPVAAFSPWNFPITISARKIGGALAAGCTCIIKPAEETPSPCLAIAQALLDAGLPRGVLNVVFGHPAAISSQLIASPVIRKVSFTGSTAVGRHIARQAADGLKKLTLELGGHAPVLVFPDVDIETVAAALAARKHRNAGQVCTAPTRFYIHDAIHDRFAAAYGAAAQAITVGPGLAPGSMMGALANGRRIDAMERLVADATAAGARLATGGVRLGGAGNFFKPTLLTDVPPSAAAMYEEPFGPMAMTARFVDTDEAIALANRLPAGLAAYVFTRSLDVATRCSDQVEAGMVGINTLTMTGPETPFGGIKESGYGSEGGSEGLNAYLIEKLVSHGTL